MKRGSVWWPWLAPVIIVILLFPMACGSKVNRDNFEKIKNDMTYEEVEGILGSATESSGVDIGGLSGGSSTWKSKEDTITIQFLNGKVKAKQFSTTGK